MSHHYGGGVQCQCFLVCLVSSSLLEKDQGHPGQVHAYGFSPVWVRRCAFRCELFVYTFKQPGYSHRCSLRCLSAASH